ncbi:MAG: sulfatase, partial [Caldilineaceae bacterium SB0664_bin_22]|nr:sulfatase [Caldilineaceae bacterium SB0664_bin_22]
MSNSGNSPLNVVLVVVDTLRTQYLEPYGNDWVHTPSIARFAAESLRFTRAYPECLPTIPTRRTLHSGRRAFPFRTYDPVPWDNVYLPGWQPMYRDEATVAEALSQGGYHTGFYSDVPHYMVPGMNFTRGFQQWEYIRGQAEDRFLGAASADEALLQRYRGNPDRIRNHLVNVRPDLPEEEWHTARTFRSAMRFLEQNQGSEQPFYLYVDSFSPHETWEAPLHYYDLYASRDVREPIWLTVPYGPLLDQNPELETSLESLKANYAGLVTLVDTWFGRLMQTLDNLKLRDRTLVILIADHGTNFADNVEKVVGKPAGYMYPGTMHIPLMVRHPDGIGAGQTSDELVYTLDVPATVMAATGVVPQGGIEGRNLLEDADGSREWLTCRYGDHVWYRDHRTWFFSSLEFEGPRVFDLEADPDCTANIAAKAGDRIDLARTRILADAGGELVRHANPRWTDAIG